MPWVQMTLDPNPCLMVEIKLSMDAARHTWQISYGVRDVTTDMLVSQVVHCSVSELHFPRFMRDVLLELEQLIRDTANPF
jgi:hypothetical protein